MNNDDESYARILAFIFLLLVTGGFTVIGLLWVAQRVLGLGG